MKFMRRRISEHVASSPLFLHLSIHKRVLFFSFCRFMIFGLPQLPLKFKPGKLLGIVPLLQMSSNPFFPNVSLSPNMSPLCFAAVESNIHLCFHCLLFSSLWGKLLQLVDFSQVMPSKAVDYFSWKAVPSNRVSRKLWLLCLPGLIWAVWLERDRRVYDNSSSDVSVVWDSVCILQRVGQKLTSPFLFLHLNHFVVLFNRFSFLMRTILNFTNIIFLLPITKKKKNL